MDEMHTIESRSSVDQDGFLPGASQTNPYLLESVVRVMNVLEAFTADRPELRLTDLSETLGMPKSQVLRIASTLEQGSFLERDPDTKRYRLGIRLLTLGTLVQRRLSLRAVAQPWVDQLAEETHETIGLFVPDRSGPICVEVRQSPKAVRVFAEPGRRMPWNAGASAKVILAFLPELDQERVFTTTTFRAFTERTITDPAKLRTLLETIRRDGYHVAVSDLDDGALGIGAPIFDHHARIVGAISVSAPNDRAPESVRPRLIKLVTATCEEISRQLGYVQSEP